ncbi:MAG: toxin-antitoxin system HicB family antitoxin [Propionibacteriaceae bacterium]|nr:toxin-antitoxin system HicB family antitoxin [Propionibacteriaceae bacterium]
MELEPYLIAVAADLDRATSLADDATKETVGRLAGSLEPALRLAMTQLLSDAAAHLSRDLGDTVVTVRIEGRDPVLQVQRHESVDAEPTVVLPTPEPEEDDGTARVTVRLPENLKRRAEELAQRADQSLNSWIVQVVRRASQGTAPSTPTHRSSRRITGWA